MMSIVISQKLAVSNVCRSKLRSDRRFRLGVKICPPRLKRLSTGALKGKGVFKESKCLNKQLSHAALVVGYGSRDGLDYYIVKNSWGTLWGDGGYILIARNSDNMCGIASEACYPLV